MKTEWKVIDESLIHDFTHLKTLCKGDFSIISRTHDDGIWVIQDTMDNGPVSWCATSVVA